LHHCVAKHCGWENPEAEAFTLWLAALAAMAQTATVKQSNSQTRVGIELPPMPPTSTGGTDNESNMTRPTILDKTKRQIIDAVSKNRLTIIIGPTG